MECHMEHFVLSTGASSGVVLLSSCAGQMWLLRDASTERRYMQIACGVQALQ